MATQAAPVKTRHAAKIHTTNFFIRSHFGLERESHVGGLTYTVNKDRILFLISRANTSRQKNTITHIKT